MATVLARYQATALDDAGNFLASPSVEVRLESTGSLVSLFSDRAGTVALGNPFTGAADGLAAFHVAGGAYKITFTKGAVTRILRYVAIATMAEIDDAPDDGSIYSRQNRTWVVGGGGGGSVIAEGGTASRTLEKHFGDTLYVEDFGAAGDGATNDRAAIQAAIDHAASVGGGIIRFKARGYFFNGALNISHGMIQLVGEGRYATVLSFNSGADGIAINISAGTSAVGWVRLQGFTLFSSDTTHTKTGIEGRDLDHFEMDDVAINGNVSGMWGGGTGSIGVRLLGRDFINIRDTCEIAAQKPLVISVNPNASAGGISFDHSTCAAYLTASGFPNITVDTGVFLTNATFSGAWTLGTHGFFWDDSSSAIASYQVKFQNLRTEQGSSPSAYSIYFKPNPTAGCNGLTIENCHFDNLRSGIFIRSTSLAEIANCVFVSATLEALNVDIMQNLLLTNNYWATGTANLGTGLFTIYKGPNSPLGGPLPGTAYYSSYAKFLTAESIIVNDAITPDTSGGANLGTASLPFAGLQLMANANITYPDLTVSHLTGGILRFVGNQVTIQATHTTAFTVGPNGSSNPSFRVATSVASAATGLAVAGQPAGSGVLLNVVSPNTDENMRIDARGTGVIRLGAGSTGQIEFARNLVPQTNDSASIGSAALGISDAFFATGAVVTFGAPSTPDVTISHATDSLILGGLSWIDFGAAWASSEPVTKTGTTGSQAASESSLIINASGTFTLTLLGASIYPGRWLFIKNIAAQTVNSASSNIVQIGGGAATAAILANTVGRWAVLQSDGTNWVIMAQGGP